MTVGEIYRILDEYAPFSLQESYDKSGLLVGSRDRAVTKVLLTLDITLPVIREAAQKGAELILAHHPVIWEPIRAIDSTHPVWHLVQNNIAAICSHTCMDIADGGLNDHVGAMLAASLSFAETPQPLAVLSGGRVLGKAVRLSESFTAEKLAGILKSVFQAQSIRYYAGENADTIKSIAWCTGSGGDLIPDAIAAGADALITGDCKHSIWAEAQNRSYTLFDCGHFETEVPVVHLFEKILRKSCTDLQILISEKGTRPFFTAV